MVTKCNQSETTEEKRREVMLRGRIIHTAVGFSFGGRESLDAISSPSTYPVSG